MPKTTEYLTAPVSSRNGACCPAQQVVGKIQTSEHIKAVPAMLTAASVWWSMERL